MRVIQFQDTNKYLWGWFSGDMMFTPELSEALCLKNRMEEMSHLMEMEKRGYWGVILDIPELGYTIGN